MPNSRFTPSGIRLVAAAAALPNDEQIRLMSREELLMSYRFMTTRMHILCPPVPRTRHASPSPGQPVTLEFQNVSLIRQSWLLLSPISKPASDRLPFLRGLRLWEPSAPKAESFSPHKPTGGRAMTSFDSDSRVSAEIAKLCELLHFCAASTGVVQNTYIVGGAVRDFVLGSRVKDLDVVIEYPGRGAADRLAEVLADHVGLSKVTADQYGVVHVGPFPRFAYGGVDLTGQKVEIVTARSEKYDKSAKSGHKPASVSFGTLHQDVMRRDFTINTLCWRLESLRSLGFSRAEVIDLTGWGLSHLEKRELVTPIDPMDTFEEDPSRILRGVRFAAKHNLKIRETTRVGMRVRARELLRLPYEVVDVAFTDRIMREMTGVVRRRAVVLLSEIDALRTISEHVPKARIRRALKDIDDVSLALLLMLDEFDLPLNKLNSAALAWLSSRSSLDRLSAGVVDHDPRVGSLSEEDLMKAARAFLSPPIDVEKLIADTGISGPQISSCITRASAYMTHSEKPWEVDREELQERVTDWAHHIRRAEERREAGKKPPEAARESE